MSEGSYESLASYKSYLIGFALSVVLTVIPFWMILSGATDNLLLTLAVIFAAGAAQVLVHIHYFLHVDVRAEQGWQAMSMVFTVVLLVIIMAGSIWIMLHLKENMMPAHEQIERARKGP